MSKSTKPAPKPKAWRARVYTSWDGTLTAAQSRETHATATIYPDGATPPLPRAVREVVRMLRLILEHGDLDMLESIGPRSIRKAAAKNALARLDRQTERQKAAK